MNICGAEIMIFVLMMIMIMVVIVMMVVVTVIMLVRMPENEGAAAVDKETNNCDDDGLIEFDGNGMQEPEEALVGHEESKDRQQEGAGKRGERIDLAGPEAEAVVMGEAPGHDIGDVAQEESERMRCHVQAIGEQGHRAIDDTSDDFDGHHRQSNEDDDQGAFFTGSGSILTEGVRVGEGFHK